MQNKRTDDDRSNYEHLEYAIAFALTLVLTLTDLGLIYLSSETHEFSSRILDEVFRGFLMSVIAVSCVTMLIRWYRHHDEILSALEKFKALKEYREIEAHITAITENALAVQQKDWPPYAREILSEELEKLATLSARLRTGTIELSFDVATAYSPHFFELTNGISFVTDYGDWDYWKSDHGKGQLESNKKVLANRPGTIIRVFILPPYERSINFTTGNGYYDASKQHDRLHDLDAIIKEQLAAGVQVRVISESKLDRAFRRDVGVFFRDVRGEDVQFVSEWFEPLHKDRRAVLFFDGNELKNAKRMYTALVRDGAAKQIRSLREWEQYRNGLSKTISATSAGPPGDQG
jgi:hypothetical protein